MPLYKTVGIVAVAMISAQAATMKVVAAPRASGPTQAQVRVLQRIPTHATLAQVKKVLPAGTRYTRDGDVTIDGYAWAGVRFEGPLRGMLVFGNNRAQAATTAAASKALSAWRAGDQLQEAYLVVGPVQPDVTKDELAKATRRQWQTAARWLGRPGKTTWYDADELPPGPYGWEAEWKRRGGRIMESAHALLMFGSDVTPLLRLRFADSHIYKP